MRFDLLHGLIKSLPRAITRELKKLKGKDASPDKAKFIDLKIGALEKAYDEVASAQDERITLLNGELREKFQRMHGLLAYGIASGGLNPDAALLFGSLTDFLGAKDEGDRQAAEKAAFLCLEHGSFGRTSNEPSILAEFEAITDPEQRSRFHRKHRTEILKALNDERE